MAEVAAPRLTFWGSRGSIPISGPGSLRYGGATACVTLTDGDRVLILDAGTGLRHYGRTLPDRPGQRHCILLSHTHWDHLSGFPFFPPLYDPDAVVEVVGPDQPTATLAAVLDEVVSPPLWPLPVRATLEVRGLAMDLDQAAGFQLRHCRLAHAGVTLGYRVTGPSGRTVSYVTDNELGAMHPAQRTELVQLLAGSDVLIHDATWTERQLPQRTGWGHSSARQAVELGLDAGCAMVVLFHHDPDADDDAVDRQVEEARRAAAGPGRPAVMAAADGLTLEL